jgi:tetratricopeptide (TPR) repeat protein
LKRDLPDSLKRPPDGYPEPAHRTYLNSIAAAEKETPLAGTLLTVLSYADPDTGFPADLLYNSTLGTKDDIDGAIAVLAGLSLLIHDDAGIHLHRLVQQARQLDVTPVERANAHDTLITALLTVFTHAREPAANRVCQQLLPHADHASQTSGANDEQRWLLATCAAIAIQYGGDPISAVTRFEAALSLTPPRGDRHPTTVAACANLGAGYLSAGRASEAVTLLEQVLIDSAEMLDDLHPARLTHRANLASGYFSVGRFSDAITLEEQVLIGRVEVLGYRHPDTLIARANLANSYWMAGRYNDAIIVGEQVLIDRVEELGDRHPSTLTARFNLAGSYWSAGRTSEAITRLDQAIKLAEDLDYLHPKLAFWKKNLAQWLEQLQSTSARGRPGNGAS